MTAISTLISAGGGGGSASFPTFFLSSSQTWVPPMDGNICIHVIGAGGAGASASSGSHPGSGGAGSYARSTNWAVTTADSYTVVIGAGGADKIGGGHSEHRGGTSQFYNASNSINMNCPGGYGGLANGYNQQTTIAYASGGTHANNAGGPGKMYWGQYAGGGAVGINAAGVSGNFDISRCLYGGECDVVGDFWSSSLGNLAGGVRGKGYYSPVVYATSHAGLMAGTDGGPLSGGGYCQATSTATSTFMRGGDGGIGAGGGGALNHSSGGAIGGKGGEGIVVIQYIP